MIIPAAAKFESSWPRLIRWPQRTAPWLLLFGLVACATDPQSIQDSDRATQGAAPEAADHTEENGVTDEPESFTIAGVGDVLIHDHLMEAAAELADQGSINLDYAFGPLMAGIEPWIAGADLALCGLEVPIAPPGEEPSGYPLFAAPEEIIPALAETGFNGCSTASNHSMDAGTEGVKRTLEVSDEHGFGHAGTARTQREAEEPQLYTLIRGEEELTVAHLATTQIHNIAPPANTPWMVTDEPAQQLTERAARARDQGADIVVVSVHWGEEYRHEPNAAQRAYGQALAEGGEVDLVLGSHPHTPQPLEQLDGGPHDDGMWLVWSMGNFLTNQDEACCVMETATGAIVYAEVEVPQGEPARVTEVRWSPVTVDRSRTEHRGVWSLAELAAAEKMPHEAELDPETVQARWYRVREVLGDELLMTEPPEPAGDAPTVVPRDR